MYLELIVRTLLTAVVYLVANYHTYNIGIEQNAPSLKDILHELLPDLSHKPYVRDYALILALVPILLIPVKNVWPFVVEFWELFIVIGTLKAICIFFTFMPPSNQHCHQTRQVNHTYHQMLSGHNSFVFLLYLLYVKHGVCKLSWKTFLPVLAYSLLILATRAHYSVDIIVSYIVVYLLVQ